jgi:hypothetical protein
VFARVVVVVVVALLLALPTLRLVALFVINTFSSTPKGPQAKDCASRNSPLLLRFLAQR